MTDLLTAYDEQLRGEAEVRGAEHVERLGPLWLAVLGDDSGFISYRELPRGSAERRRSITDALDRLRRHPAVRQVEWKTRAHDDAPGLPEELTDAGFVADEPESIMLGEAALLAQDLPLPEGVRLRPVADPADVARACAMADAAFGRPSSPGHVQDVLGRIATGAELWVAERDGEVISTGRLEPVAGTAFAGIWGGATRPDSRHLGVYRALTAARARVAISRGFRYLHSDSTEYSRPILERSGFRKVSETTPFMWRRAR